MVFSTRNLESELLESTAGRAVFDALVQANVNVKTVSVELVKQMLVAECQHLRSSDRADASDRLIAC